MKSLRARSGPATFCPQISAAIICLDRKKIVSFLSISLIVSLLIPCLALAGLCDNSHTEAVPTNVAHPDPIPVQKVKAGSKGVKLKGAVQQNQQMAALNLELGFVAKPQGKEAMPARLSTVTPGSLIAKYGIAPGDTLVGETTNDDGSVSLTMEHGGQAMRLTLQAKDLSSIVSKIGPLKSDANKLAIGTKQMVNGTNQTQLSTGTTGGAPSTLLNSNLKRSQLKSIVDVLQNHDLGLIIDSSGSMHTPDCPGPTSRWDWCCLQAGELAQAAADAAGSIDASIFNTAYQTYRNISPTQIPLIFQQNRPAGGTEPAYALQEQMENYFKGPRSKPLTIVIITDGEPNRPANIAQVLHDESQKIRYQGEITITFLLIGNEVDEQTLRSKIGLRSGSSAINGGFVDIIPFDRLAQNGMKQSLYEDLKEIRLATDPSKASHAADTATGISSDPRAPFMTPPNIQRNWNGRPGRPYLWGNGGP